MKKFFILIFITLLLSCVPKLIKQDGKNYTIIDWNGGNFVYVTYYWKGGKFDDAIELIRKINDIKKERGLDELLLARFPAAKEWQLGFISNGTLDFTTINDYKIEQMVIPEGKYASMKSKGYPEFLFTYYEKLKKWVIDDGLIIDSSVFEIYNDKTFDQNISSTERSGELRYKIKY